MTKRLLDIVDCQNGFMRADSDLPVPGAEDIINKINDFFAQVFKRDFDLALFKFDTHFAGEYPHSPEATPFPNIHCEYQTSGWQLAINPHKLSGKPPIYFMAKNAFDMWGTNPTGVPSEDIKFKNDQERLAYQNLFHITRDPDCIEPGLTRDAFMDEHSVGPGTEIVMIGVASNFCVDDAILGYLKRACKVTVLTDLVRGIPLPKEAVDHLASIGQQRAGSGDIKDVYALDKYSSHVQSGQLRLTTSQHFLMERQRSGDRMPPDRLHGNRCYGS